MLEIRTPYESKVSIRVKGQDDNDLAKSFDGFSKEHNVPVLGLYPDFSNAVTITLESRTGKVTTLKRQIKTEPLPDTYPSVKFVVHNPSRMSPGFTFVHLGRYDGDGNYFPLTSAIDNFGKVRWFYYEDIGHVFQRLKNGNLMITKGKNIVEIDMLGQPTGNMWAVPNGIHHDVVELPNGNFLGLSSGENSFEDVVVEIDRQTGDVVDTWDYNEILDRNRPPQPRNLRQDDWLHLNALVYDEKDNAMIVSGRDQSAVVKIGKDTKEVIWILGNHEHWKDEFTPYLLTPTGDNFEWQWWQHAPMLHPDSNNRILIFDNGNERSCNNPVAPKNNYSRAVEYLIGTDRMSVTQLWQYGKERGFELFAPFIGDADYLPNGNRLVCFGGVTRTLSGEPIELFDFEQNRINRMKISAHIIEVTGDVPAEVVSEMVFENTDMATYAGYRAYRALRMPLYPSE